MKSQVFWLAKTEFFLNYTAVSIPISPILGEYLNQHNKRVGNCGAVSKENIFFKFDFSLETMKSLHQKEGRGIRKRQTTMNVCFFKSLILSDFFSYCGITQKFKTEGWASLVAQMVKNLPAVQETQV